MKLVRPLVVLALATLSCQVIFGFEEPRGNPPEPIAQEDAGVPIATDPCNHQRPAAPPRTDDDPTTKKAYWLATERLTAPLPADAGVKPGLDLDNACTCQADLFDGGPTCRTPAGNGVTCDFDGGVDDGFGTIAAEFASPFPDFDPMQPVNNQLQSGIRTLLWYIKDYNGKANDSEVGVEFAGAGGLYTNRGCNDEERPNRVTFADPSLEGLPDKRYAPLGDGCDRWSPGEGQTIGTYPNRVPPGVGAAYVSNFQLVVSFREAGAPLFGGATKLTNGFAVANLRFDPNGKLRAEGILTGRIPFVDLLDLIGRTPVNKPGGSEKQPFCETAFWPQVAARFCSARDTMASPAEERLGRTCDATSTALGFTLVEAQVSDVAFTNPQAASTCRNSNFDCP